VWTILCDWCGLFQKMPLFTSCEALVGGWRAGKVERRRRKASNESQPERNAAARPQTEAWHLCGKLLMPACDERGFCVAEQAWSQGKQGKRQSCEAQQ
ncbi:MAG: hypothetical protein WBS33_10290, partial [Verrucomicrobiia bacterium]